MTDDSLGDLSMKPTRDDLAQRQTSRGKPAKTAAPKKAPSPAGKPSGAPAPSQGALWSVLIVVMVCSAGGGWYLWDKVERLQASLSKSTEALASAEQALSSLQKNLANRDATLSKSGDDMASDIKLLESEVRKLWDLANKRNKPEIVKLSKQIDALKSDLKASSGTLSGMSKQVSASADQLAGLKKQLTQAQENSSTLASATDTLKKELAQLKAVLGSAADFDDRITSVEVAIKSIDAYRSQVNGRLEKLDREVGALMQGGNGP